MHIKVEPTVYCTCMCHSDVHTTLHTQQEVKYVLIGEEEEEETLCNSKVMLSTQPCQFPEMKEFVGVKSHLPAGVN